MLFKTFVLLVFVQFSYEKGVSLDSEKIPCACGSINRKPRIVGGEETEIGKYPWMVAFKHSVPVGNSITVMDQGGGALINQRYVISAAHNFLSITAISQLTAILGDHDSSSIDEIASVMRNVSSVMSHPKFNITNVSNDIAIVKLSSPVIYQWNIQPICLPSTDLNLLNQELIIMGWGSVQLAGSPSKVLREAIVPVISNDECQIMLSETFPNVRESTICAGTKDGSKDACQGDSGGPAVFKCGGDGTLAGIVSFGIGCGNPGYPGVYTRVSCYVDWIMEHIQPKFLCGSQCLPNE